MNRGRRCHFQGRDTASWGVKRRRTVARFSQSDTQQRLISSELQRSRTFDRALDLQQWRGRSGMPSASCVAQSSDA